MSTDLAETEEAVNLDGSDSWNRLVHYLQSEVWIEHEILLKALEEEIKKNRDAKRVTDDRAFNLARLRLALIQAQVQAAPDWFDYEGSDEYVMLEAAKETARFFKSLALFTSTTPDDLVRLPSAEFDGMKALADEMGKKSWKGDPIAIRHARSARRHRSIFRAETNVFKTSEILKAHDFPIGSAPLRSDVMESRRSPAIALDKILK